MLETAVKTETEIEAPQPKARNLLTVIPFAALLVIYLPALYDLVVDWYTDANYSHGFLVPVISGVLLWKKREKLAAARRALDRRGLIVIVAGLGLFIIANGAAEYCSLRLSFVLTLFGLTYYLFGREVMKLCWFEIFFLVFMIPIPYVIYYGLTFPMQTLAAKITAGALHFIGMGTIRQGNIIHISGHSLEVAEACSGIRSLVSLLALGAIYAHVTQRRFTAQLVLFLSTVPIAVISNVFRVFVTSLLVYTVTDRITEEPLHSIMGLSVFVAAFVMLFTFGLVLRKVFK